MYKDRMMPCSVSYFLREQERYAEATRRGDAQRRRAEAARRADAHRRCDVVD
jgi:hypothetical protein